MVRFRATVLLALALGLVASASPAHADSPGVPHLPDFENVIPANQMSIVRTAEGREFRYTHQIFNSGAGPLEIQPEYNLNAGTYQGVQHVYTHDGALTWTIASTAPIAGAFVFHAEHGHFHFPLAAFGLYTVAPDGGIGAPATLSPKNGFCIADSSVRDFSLPHAGEFGDWGSCSDPLSIRGVSVGAVDEYDYRDPGQSVPIDGLPDGTYWFRAIVDPFDYLAESDESNNETDVKITIVGDVVQTFETVTPDSTPPSLQLSAPTEGATVVGTVALTATNLAGASGVQFLLNGQPLGSPVPTPPYVAPWDTTSVTNGIHWLAAQSTNAAGIGGTSNVVRVRVHNEVTPSGELAIDRQVYSDGAGTRTVVLSTDAGGELLLAFVSADGPPASGQTATVSGAGLVWSLVARANEQAGTSEIWTATAASPLADAIITASLSSPDFDQSLTVIAFRGAEGLGAIASENASSGAPEVELVSTRAGSWTFAVGNDWDNAIARTLPDGQTMHHEWVDTGVGDTFWVQSQSTPVASSGTLVRVGASAPTTDRWNLAAVEVIPTAADTSPPTISLSDPEPDAILSGNTAVAAIVSDDRSISVVQFTLDGAPLGNPDPSPPYLITWNTRASTDGPHRLGAIATDAAGNVGQATEVPVVVDNSLPPPDPIAIQALLPVDGQGTLTTAPFAAAAPGTLLVAFVAYDGAQAQAQTASVSGAGLGWTLVKRSNAQNGTSEIWSAKTAVPLADATVTAQPGDGGDWRGSLVVVAFANAAGVGIASAASAPAGAPNVYVPGVAEGNWVFAVGNDPDGAVPRAPITGQVIVHESLDATADAAFWLQSTAATATALGIVEIRDTAPLANQWNYAAVEIVATRSCPTGSDPDGDGVCAPSDNCPTVANADQADEDADGVGTACDNCVGVPNPRVGSTFLAANPWATLTGGQRDDDRDGYGNRCDAKFPGVAGALVGAEDLAQFRASNGRLRTLDVCGTLGTRPCAIFDLDESSLVIGAADLAQFRLWNGKEPGPTCAACPLTCTAGTAGSCD